MPYTADIIAKAQALLDEGNAKGDRVAAWEQIQGELFGANLAWKSQVPPEFAGVHPANRSFFGVGGSESHQHGAQILQAGWSWAKCADVTAIEAPPEPNKAESIAANNRWVVQSDGLIPPLSDMKILSIGGAHTNGFLRAVKAGCRTTVKTLADKNGKLNMEELCCNRPAFRDAVTHGLRWFVIEWQAPTVWPSWFTSCKRL